MARLVHIFRHLVKGLRPESLESVLLETAKSLPGDRALAFLFDDAGAPTEGRDVPDSAVPWVSKRFLAEQHDWPVMARYVPSISKGRLEIRDSVGEVVVAGLMSEPSDRVGIARWMAGILQASQPYAGARHPTASPLRLIGSTEGTRYPDGESGLVSIGCLSSLGDLNAKLGLEVDPRQMRLNLWLDGTQPWEEQSWVGRELQVGGARLRIVKPIGRCPNIDLHPETGERIAEVFARMKAVLGHGIFGLKADVIAPGEIRIGDDAP